MPSGISRVGGRPGSRQAGKGDFPAATLKALRVALRGSGAFDLVITDVRMPVMDGWELGRRLLERWPGLPVLYISGYDVELTRGARSTGAPQAFLRKPFDSDDLVRYVTRLLGER